MKEHPIPFQPWGMAAILDGHKSQTRRLIKPQPVCLDLPVGPRWRWEPRPGRGVYQHPDPKQLALKMANLSPYGAPGDRLWVRERHRLGVGVANSSNHWVEWTVPGAIGELLGERSTQPDDEGHVPWPYELPCAVQWSRNRPSIHMPRWACRQRLINQSVRAERVQEITLGDFRREGGRNIRFRDGHGDLAWTKWNIGGPGADPLHKPEGQWGETWRKCWASAWDAIHGKGAWSANPWVWVIGFERAEGDDG